MAGAIASHLFTSTNLSDPAALAAAAALFASGFAKVCEVMRCIARDPLMCFYSRITDSESFRIIENLRIPSLQ